MSKVLFCLCLLLLFVVTGCSLIQEERIQIDGKSSSLEDVSGGSASGSVVALFSAGQYNLNANFENLPEPEGTDFYEGWIVRKGIKFNVISTGKAVPEGGRYVNRFKSNENLLDHTFYVLTLEPDDGDPSPAKHILEGTMK